MKVYVLETGCYTDRGIEGVYSLVEKAMAAWQPKAGAVKGFEYGKDAGQPFSYVWGEKDGDTWYFGADWGDAASITEYEVE